MEHFVITIGREYGSGGKEISEKLAEKLNIRCYDSELITLAAKNSSIAKEIFQNNDEKPTNSFLYSLVMDTYSMNGYTPSTFIEMPLNHKVFLAQFDTIKKIAKLESCIIVGRCADYALADEPYTCSFFLHAPVEFRLERVRKDLCESYKDDEKLIDYIHRMDKKRANYYNYYSNKKWGDSRSYDLCIDTSALGIDKTVDFILAYIGIRYPNFSLESK